jgi:hypothetical protein
MTNQHGRRWQPSRPESFESGIPPLQESEYAALSSHKEWFWLKQHHQMEMQEQVHIQTPTTLLVHSLILFSQHGDPLDISLALVPPNHPLIPQRNLEAEASGLLDRMLGVLHENPT